MIPSGMWKPPKLIPARSTNNIVEKRVILTLEVVGRAGIDDNGNNILICQDTQGKKFWVEQLD